MAIDVLKLPIETIDETAAAPTDQALRRWLREQSIAAACALLVFALTT